MDDTKNPDFSTAKIRSFANCWSLAGDAALLNHLETFSNTILMQSRKTQADLLSLNTNVNEIGLAVSNATNKFMSLQDAQFVENRISEEDELKVVNEDNSSTAISEDEAPLNQYKKAVEMGLNLLDTHFEKVEIVVSSDSEDDEPTIDTNIIWKPKNIYTKPLPFLIGSSDWWTDTHIPNVDSMDVNELDDFPFEKENEPEVSNTSEVSTVVSSSEILKSERTQVPTDIFSPQDFERSDNVISSKCDQSIIHATSENKPDSIKTSNETSCVLPQNSKFTSELAAKLQSITKSPIIPKEPSISKQSNESCGADSVTPVPKAITQKHIQKLREDSATENSFEDNAEKPKPTIPQSSLFEDECDNVFTKPLVNAIDGKLNPPTTNKFNKLASSTTNLFEDDSDDPFSFDAKPVIAKKEPNKKTTNLFDDIEDDTNDLFSSNPLQSNINTNNSNAHGTNKLTNLFSDDYLFATPSNEAINVMPNMTKSTNEEVVKESKHAGKSLPSLFSDTDENDDLFGTKLTRQADSDDIFTTPKERSDNYDSNHTKSEKKDLKECLFDESEDLDLFTPNISANYTPREESQKDSPAVAGTGLGPSTGIQSSTPSEGSKGGISQLYDAVDEFGFSRTQIESIVEDSDSVASHITPDLGFIEESSDLSCLEANSQSFLPVLTSTHRIAGITNNETSGYKSGGFISEISSKTTSHHSTQKSSNSISNEKLQSDDLIVSQSSNCTAPGVLDPVFEERHVDIINEGMGQHISRQIKDLQTKMERDKNIPSTENRSNHIPPKVIGKLNIPTSLKINPSALIPGAAIPKLSKVSPVQEASSEVTVNSFDQSPEGLLTSLKGRTKIQVKRRPQSRKARQDALRFSGMDYDIETSQIHQQTSPNSLNPAVNVSQSSDPLFENEFNEKEINQPKDSFCEPPESTIQVTNPKPDKQCNDIEPKQLAFKPSISNRDTPPPLSKVHPDDKEEDLFSPSFDEDDDDLFSTPIPKLTAFSLSKHSTQFGGNSLSITKKENEYKNLFDDDGDDDSDIFGTSTSVPRVSTSISKVNTIEESDKTNLFDDPLGILKDSS